MDIYGIKNITQKELEFDYDKYYKDMALILKRTENKEEQNILREKARNDFNLFLDNIKIDLKVLNQSFVHLLLDINSAKLLWILYSKYDGKENYIDKISSTLRKENEVIRGGTNTYKMNGWMAHTIYAYQISNYNIPQNKELVNFNKNEENKKQIKELHKIYENLTKESRFILKIFCLIHDIGVVEDISKHDILGAKYVLQILLEIGLTEEKLKEIDMHISMKDLMQTLKTLISYHTLISSLSTEGSDEFVENTYKDLIKNIPNVVEIKNQIPEILFIMGYGDIVAVDEILMDSEKYKRVKECFKFFKEVEENKIHKRNKTKVALERISDTTGCINYDTLQIKIDDILKKLSIDKNQFIDDMYDIKLMRYTAPLMRTIADLKLTIKVYDELFKLIKEFDGKAALKEYTIIFVPNRHEKEFAIQIKNDNFFKCINNMKILKKRNLNYKNVSIELTNTNFNKVLSVKIIN